MDAIKGSFTLAGVREMDLTAFLEQLGYQVAARKKNDTDYWYLSPLREERTPSFHVNRLTNEWYDFGLMAGGNPVDFCLRYFQCTLTELGDKFQHASLTRQTPVFDPGLHEGRLVQETRLKVCEVRSISAYPLKNYLHERSIPIAVAENFCKELVYEIQGRRFYGIGFPNDSGGWEIRNKNFKQSSAPKDITCLGSGGTFVHVFEGFMDFLSYQAMHLHGEGKRPDFVVLNGAGLFDRALPFLQAHAQIHLWLDRDVTGMAYRDHALSLGQQFVDESSFYEGCKDLNDWLQQKSGLPGRRHTKSLRPG